MSVVQSKRVEECDGCAGGSLRISGLCVLHYVAKNYSLEEFETAKEEVEGLEERREKHRESKQEFKERAEAAFPERWVSTRTPTGGLTDPFRGQNIYWSANPTQRYPEVYHSDKNCPHFPDGRLIAYPADYLKSMVTTMRACDFCVHGGDE